MEKRLLIIVGLLVSLVAKAQLPVLPVALTSASAVFSDWANRVQTNGGARPSTTSITAANNFLTGLTNYGLNNLLLCCNFFAPDSLTACITPLIIAPGTEFQRDPWVNISFVSGDLTADGLKGDGSTKYLKSGFNMTNFTLTSSSLIVYEFSSSSGGFDTGGQLQSSATRIAYIGHTNVQIYDCNNFTVGQGELSLTANASNGCYVATRTSSSSQNIYYMNSGVTFNSLGSSATTGGTGPPDVEMAVYALNNVNPVPSWSFFCNARLSFVGYGSGLTSVQSSNMCNLVQKLRVDLGGGYR